VNSIAVFYQYLRYRMRAFTKHDIHSPFVFDLVTQVIDDKSHRPSYDRIEVLRKSLLKSADEIEVLDLGAGSGHMKGDKRKVRDIAAHAGKQSKYGRLLFRLSERFNAAEMLELGTSLGISALYQKAGNRAGHMTSLEGCPNTAAIAAKNFQSMDMADIRIMPGDFDQTLPLYLQSIQKLDQVFFDGNHRHEPTIRYFRACLAKAHEGSVFIVDDIHWSPGMEAAWEEIKAMPEVTVTLDLFFMGLVFFRKGQAREHFEIRF
jgi:predicted O-methyltransferase YrrM